MYDFIQDGFSAMKPLKSAEAFIKTFTEKNARLLKSTFRTSESV